VKGIENRHRCSLGRRLFSFSFFPLLLCGTRLTGDKGMEKRKDVFSLLFFPLPSFSIATARTRRKKKRESCAAGPEIPPFPLLAGEEERRRVFFLFLYRWGKPSSLFLSFTSGAAEDYQYSLGQGRSIYMPVLFPFFFLSVIRRRLYSLFSTHGCIFFMPGESSAFFFLFFFPFRAGRPDGGKFIYRV